MTHPHTDASSSPPPDLETRIRQIIHTAHQNGHPTPGRPTLIRQTGATDHAVKRVLASLATERHQNSTPPDARTATTDTPGHIDHPALALVTTNPANDIPDSTPPGDTTDAATTSGGDHTTRSITSTGDHQPSHAAGGTSRHQTSSPGATDRQNRHQLTPAGGRLVAWTGFLFGSITSIAASVPHAWLPSTDQPPGWAPGLAPQMGTTVWPIGLMLAVEALSRIHWPAGWTWTLARFGGAVTVTLGSAVISYGHLRDVLVAWNYSPLAAAVGPLVLDGLMIFCGFALLANSLTNQHQQPPDNHQ